MLRATAVVVGLIACGGSPPPAPQPIENQTETLQATEAPTTPPPSTLHAYFADAAGLPVGSSVLVAGLPVGEVTNLEIVGGRARLDLRITADIVICSNAVLSKRSSSLLGSFFLELDPGTCATSGGVPDGAPQPLRVGDEIREVLEESSTDDILRRLEATTPIP